MDNSISIIIPAKNEAESLSTLLPKLKEQYPHAELIIIDDGSTDETRFVAEHNGARVIHHPYSIGNGGAIKAGARAAKGQVFIFMDADSQHQVEDIKILMAEYNKGHDMVVGVRDKTAQASRLRAIGNQFYNTLASWIVGHPVLDLTSGFRIVNGRKFKEFLHLLPNGFSYPSTITLAFFRSGYTVSYVPITVLPRKGKSHLRVLPDGIRFLIIIYKVATLYSPLKVFIPLACLHFFAGIANYLYTYTTQGRFTNMSAVLIMVSVLIFLIGLVSEQITTLMYQQRDKV